MVCGLSYLTKKPESCNCFGTEGVYSIAYYKKPSVYDSDQLDLKALIIITTAQGADVRLLFFFFFFFFSDCDTLGVSSFLVGVSIGIFKSVEP